jgi:hypothetical protein
VKGVSLATGQTAIPHAAQQLSKHKVKTKQAGQRACNEKDDKGKFCGGHLKRWFYASDAIEQECGCLEKAKPVGPSICPVQKTLGA